MESPSLDEARSTRTRDEARRRADRPGAHPVGGRFDHGPSDRVLAARARSGDGDAFSTLLRRHDAAMRRVAFRLLGDAHSMDDALQDAYIKAFRALGGYRDDAEFSSWLYRIVYNACLDELRRAKRRPGLDDEIGARPSTVPGPERVVAAADAVRRALAALPLDQRSAVVLVDGEGLDYQGAAEVLGTVPGTIASRLSRARAALRQLLKETTDDRA